MSTTSNPSSTSTAEQVVSAEVKVCNQRGSSLSAEARDLARDLYRNLTMGADAYLNMLPHVKSPELKTDMTAAMCYYEKTIGKVRTFLADAGEEAPEPGKAAKFWAKMGIAMNTALDSTESHLAEMLIEGCTMSVTTATRLGHNAESGRDGEDCRELREICRDWSAFEERHMEKLKAYL